MGEMCAGDKEVLDDDVCPLGKEVSVVSID